MQILKSPSQKDEFRVNIWYLLVLGRELEITTSEYSLPTIAKEDQDWFSTLQEMMNWNVRARQKKIQTKNKTDDKWLY